MKNSGPKNGPECDSGEGAVNGFSIKRLLREPEGSYLTARLRISGYLRGCFSRGARFYLWNNERFARATRSHKPLSVKHLERVWPIFREHTPHWSFEKIRLGRSFRWKVTPKWGEILPAPARAPPAADLGELRARLVGYVKGAARNEGSILVNDDFLGQFCRTTGLDFGQARAALPTLRRIQGLRVFGRKGPRGLKLRVSLPHFSGGVSSPSGRRLDKTTRERCPRGFPNQNSGSLRSQHGGLRPLAFAVNGRWVSGRRLWALACHLATGPLRLEHREGLLVRWRFTHARNFAYRALQAGFAAPAIVTAYGGGLARSHADARDGNETAPRQPSAAVAYGAAILAADPRSLEVRWGEFFESHPDGAAARKLSAETYVKPRRMTDFQRDYAGVNDEDNQAGRPAPKALAGGGAAAAGKVKAKAEKLVAYLAAKGIAPADFLAMDWRTKATLVRGADGGAGS
jgi:hypothetical protein